MKASDFALPARLRNYKGDMMVLDVTLGAPVTLAAEISASQSRTDKGDLSYFTVTGNNEETKVYSFGGWK